MEGLLAENRDLKARVRELDEGKTPNFAFLDEEDKACHSVLQYAIGAGWQQCVIMSVCACIHAQLCTPVCAHPHRCILMPCEGSHVWALWQLELARI